MDKVDRHYYRHFDRHHHHHHFDHHPLPLRHPHALYHGLTFFHRRCNGEQQVCLGGQTLADQPDWNQPNKN